MRPSSSSPTGTTFSSQNIDKAYFSTDQSPRPIELSVAYEHSGVSEPTELTENVEYTVPTANSSKLNRQQECNAEHSNSELGAQLANRSKHSEPAASRSGQAVRRVRDSFESNSTDEASEDGQVTHCQPNYPTENPSEQLDDSWRTVQTLQITDSEREGFKSRSQHRGFNQRGRLARDNPDVSMDDAATQPAHLPQMDPREQKGNHALISKEDRTDILCILSPGTLTACQAVELVAATAPQHILQNLGHGRGLSASDENLDEADLQEDRLPADPHKMALDETVPSKASRPSLDIALRLSSKIINPVLGFTFGRAKEKSDLLISPKGQQKRVSGMHFRIYINPKGSLMCADTSTNGTWVDGRLLKDKSTLGPQSTIHDGSTIEIMSGERNESMRFYVSTPDRTGVSLDYGRRLEEYLRYLDQVDRQQQEENRCRTEGLPVTLSPIPIPPFNHALQGERLSVAANKNLVAATEPYNHGMQWNGGVTYKVTGFIGKGAFAIVYQLSRRHDGEKFAVKELKKTSLVQKGVIDRRVDQELEIMKSLEHYVDHHEVPDYLYIIMELVLEGDLQSCLCGNQRRLQESHCQTVGLQMCQALKYLHDRGITHRDIKPDNILIKSRDPYVFKLSDFGLSKVVKDDETFLKSFCGTLLYCAPEVYPGYDSIQPRPLRKRARAKDGSFIKQKPKQPYTSAVDTWGLAAVLYHLLCGEAPFTGTTTNHGAQMLHNIMHGAVDYNKLRLAGASNTAIDFLSHMLVTEPSLRRSDVDCLDHPWINPNIQRKRSLADVENWTQQERPENYATRDTERAEPDELNAFASQLSINDSRPGLDQSSLSVRLQVLHDDMAQSKRKRDADESSESGLYEDSIAEYNDDLLPSESQIQAAQPPPGKKFFGEIDPSALRSSGVLARNVNVALEMPSIHESRGAAMSESHDEGESLMSLTNDPESQSEPAHGTQQSQRSDGAAPSLLGAEALVDQLKMDSHMADVTAPNTDGQPATPRPEGSPQPERHQQQIVQDQASEPRSSNSSQGLYSASPLQSQTDPKRATSPKSNIVNAEGQPKGAAATTSKSSQSHQPPAGSAEVPAHQANQTVAPIIADPTPSKPVTQVQNISTTSPQPQSKDPSPLSTAKSTTSASPKPPRPSASLPPPNIPPYGTLTPTTSSPPLSPSIHLTARITSFGRFTSNTHIWPDSKDTRVPKCAFDILFWRPGLDRDLLHRPNLEWQKFNDIWAIITTRATSYISVNGIRLERGKDCFQYGKLHTGDVVTVFEPAPGKKLRGKEAEALRFKVEVKIGKSRRARKEEEIFTVIKDEKMFQKVGGKSGKEGEGEGSQVSAAVSSDAGKAGEKKDARGDEAGGGKETTSASASLPAPKVTKS
ncbi:MAG: hypothetical protein Q9222_004451 [Ikaeria aurantiellina]